MDTNFDLGDPAAREAALRSISPERARENHALLKQIFEAEIEYRRADDDYDYFENIYWCAWLLFLVGDLHDVERMWVAKHLNMDTGTGFDLENMVGAGVHTTIDFLRQRGHAAIAKHLEERFPSGSADEIREWSESRRRYFDAI
jgi:hypothetical protein